MPEPFKEERIVFSTNGTGITGHPHAKGSGVYLRNENTCPVRTSIIYSSQKISQRSVT